jgi:hypothetical protein
MNIKENILKIVYADTVAAEFLMGFYAIGQGGANILVPGLSRLEIVIVSLGVARVIALVMGKLWLRLGVAYVVTFVWLDFTLFQISEEPLRQLSMQITGVVAAAANIWIAWRLQTHQTVRRDLGR